MTRVLVIVIQEVTRDLIDPWVAQGLLPNLAALMRTGSSGHVRARAPLITPHSMANVLTGRDAGQHGVFDYWQRGNDGVFRETCGASLRAAPIWELLRGSGLRSTFINVPLTWPLPTIDGTVVAGRAAGSSTRALFSDGALHDRLVAAHGPYRLDATAPGGRRKADYLKLFDAETPRTAQAFEFVLNAEPWDFAMVYFIDAAMAQHYFWADMGARGASAYQGVIASAYQNLDTAIGRLVRAAGADTVTFVCSECGAGALRGGVDLNGWLEQHGWLRPIRRPLDPLKHLLEERVLPRAKRLLPAALKTALTQHAPALQNWAASSGTQLEVDWPHTQVFSRGKEGNLFVNRAGRDPHGIVAPGAAEDALLDGVTEALRRLKDPHSGAPVVARVVRPRHCYRGAALEFAPDLIVDWTDAAYMTTERRRAEGGIFGERWRKGMSWPTTGAHRYDGALIAAGPGIGHGQHVDPLSPFDLLPTWLNLLGQPIPTGLNGVVRADLMES